MSKPSVYKWQITVLQSSAQQLNDNKNNKSVFLMPVKKLTLEASALTSVSSGESLITFFASLTNAHHVSDEANKIKI